MKAIIAALVLISLNATAHDMPTPTISKDFKALKALEGTWTGEHTEHGKKEKTSVTYKVTSNGTALVETLAAGTPMEMVSVYADRKDKVTMTHFCAVGNQPVMDLKKADGKTFTFEMTGTQGIDDPKEMHMHAVTLTLLDNKHLKQEWTNYTDGKKAETAVFEFTRK